MSSNDFMLYEKSISVVLTSCNRHDLLHRTLKSFVDFNTFYIEQVIIIEDSSARLDQKVIRNILDSSVIVDYKNCELICIDNGENIGQMKSIDKAYNKVKSSYIFHCEDDWEFHKLGFIERSLDILNVEEKVFTVWLRAHNDLNGHKISQQKTLDNGPIKYHEIIPMGIWSGFTLNPGLRRTKDCLIFNPYAEQEQVDGALKKRDSAAESDLSILYGELGFGAVVTSDAEGFVIHIGDGHHISNVWENKYTVKLKNVVKRLYKLIK